MRHETTHEAAPELLCFFVLFFPFLLISFAPLLLTSFALPGPGRKEARSIDKVSGQYREEYCFHHWLTT